MIHIVFASTGTIDTVDKYAWGENVGWINFGTSQGNVTVTDSELTGYAWGENIGWISLNCSNTSTCATVDYKVSNSSGGSLSGYAWSENGGWINFSPGFGKDPSIGSGGEFTGYAWGENVGWLNFNCSNGSYCSIVDYKVKTSWRPTSSGGGGQAPAPVQQAPQPSSSTAPTSSVVPTSSPITQPSSTPQSTSLATPVLTVPITSPPSEPPTGIQPPAPPLSETSSGIPNTVSEKIITAVTAITDPLIKSAMPIIKKTSQPLSVISGVGVAFSTAASAVSVASSGVSMFSYIEFFLKNILVFFGIKKKTRAWGTIYNAITKQPLSYTKVQLLGNDLRVLETRITDRDGRYGFLASEGEFMIAPLRDGFTFPSQRVTGQTDTVLYPKVYNGGIAKAQSQELIKFDIPMDPIQSVESIKGIKMPRAQVHNFLAIISHIMFWIALIAMPLNYIFNPTFVNLVMLVIFGGLNLLIFVGDLQQRPYGVVIDRMGETPIPYSLITLNNMAGERRGFTVSDEQGRYFLLSEKGTFKINVFTPAQISPPRSSEESFTTDRGWIAKKLNL